MKKWTIMLFFVLALFLSQNNIAYAQECSSLTKDECIGRSDCCWSDFWNFCAGLGDTCCHDKAYGTPWYTQCPNDALDCYVCDGGWVNKCETGEINTYARFAYDTRCKDKQIGDSCDTDGITDAHCTSFCSCGYVESVEDPVHPLQVYCSLPGSVCQQDDGIGGYLVGCSESSKPTVRFIVNEGGCSIDESTTAGRYYCSGSSCGCEFGWNFPKLPAGCLGKTVTFTISSEGVSASKAIKLSNDSTRDEPPNMPQFGTWSPNILLTNVSGRIFPNDIVSYTAKAVDDKGLKEIQIYKYEETPTPGYKLAKTCQVSGLTATCTISGGPYPAGTEICYKGNAVDIKGQTVPSNALGARRDCATVCDFANDSDNGINYSVKGTCKGCEQIELTDMCPWEGPKGYCCDIFNPTSDDSYYSLVGRYDEENISEDGTVKCCKLINKFQFDESDCKYTNCKNILIDYKTSSDKKFCIANPYDCSKEGKTCRGGICVLSGVVTTTTTTIPSTSTTTKASTTTTSTTTVSGTTTVGTTTSVTTTTVPGTTSTTAPVIPPEICMLSSSRCSLPDGTIEIGQTITGCLNKYDNKYYNVSNLENKLVRVKVEYYGDGCDKNGLYIYTGDCDRLYKNTEISFVKAWDGYSESGLKIRLDGNARTNINCQWNLKVSTFDIACGDCHLGNDCKCELTDKTYCTEGMWVARKESSYENPVLSGISSDLVFKPSDKENRLVSAICFNPLNYKQKTVTVR